MMWTSPSGRHKADIPTTTIVVRVSTEDIPAIMRYIRTFQPSMPKELKEFLQNVYNQFG